MENDRIERTNKGKMKMSSEHNRTSHYASGSIEHGFQPAGKRHVSNNGYKRNYQVNHSQEFRESQPVRRLNGFSGTQGRHQYNHSTGRAGLYIGRGRSSGGRGLSSYSYKQSRGRGTYNYEAPMVETSNTLNTLVDEDDNEEEAGNTDDQGNNTDMDSLLDNMNYVRHCSEFFQYCTLSPVQQDLITSPARNGPII